MPHPAPFRAGAALLLALALSGCIGLGGAKAPPLLLNLTAAKSVPAGSAISARNTDAVMVMQPETDRRLSVQRVPVQVDASSVAYLKDAVWVERPARLFQGLLAETLRAQGRRLVLEDGDGVAVVGQRLSGRLLDLGYDARSQSAVVRFDAIKTAADGTVETRRFEGSVRGVQAKAGPVGAALNRAANDVAGQVAEWVSGG